MSLRVEIVTDRRGLDALRPEWHELLCESASPNVFLTWEWIALWWDIYHGSSHLHVITVRDTTGRLVGLALFQRQVRRALGLTGPVRLRFIGDGGDVTPEHLDVIAWRGWEEAVAKRVGESLSEDVSIATIDLRPTPAASPLRRTLQSIFETQSGRVSCAHDSTCPILVLPDSVERFMAAQSSNYRKKIGEYERRCNRELHATVRRSASVEDVARDMATLVSLHHERWQGRSGSFRTRQYIAFHEQLARTFLERGWLRLFSLESGTQVLAVLYCFTYRGRYYFYQSGRDPQFARYRVGLVLMHRVVQEAIREGASVFDFLRGEETYKYRWATSHLDNVRLTYWKSLPAWVDGQVRDGLRRFSLGTRAGVRLAWR
jgi:CelD/BcsL family acetyltransferase involved in cellulose biosynthesis